MFYKILKKLFMLILCNNEPIHTESFVKHLRYTRISVLCFWIIYYQFDGFLIIFSFNVLSNLPVTLIPGHACFITMSIFLEYHPFSTTNFILIDRSNFSKGFVLYHFFRNITNLFDWHLLSFTFYSECSTPHNFFYYLPLSACESSSSQNMSILSMGI